ncbi:MAG TPA: radical SAM protein, partial [Elusimicrobiales bacterium]|nr:radical SAM protein [Elusimicrobiales bacterium]
MKKKRATTQGPRPSFLLELVLSNRCNLDCDYCSSSFLLKDGTRKVLPFAALRRAVGLYAAALKKNGHGGGGLVSFTGNEPLLEFPLLRRVVRYIRRAHPGMRMRLDTNGVLLDAEKASFLSRNGVRIFVSLDGCR